MTARMLVAGLLVAGSLPLAAQGIRPTTQAARAVQCDQERARLQAEGWDISNVHLLCEPNVTAPERLRDIKPQYTPDGMRAKIQGPVRVAAIVEEDGVIREARVVQSLDKVYGLDEQALKAVRAMPFKAAQLKGQAVRTLVMFEMQFTLR